MTESEFNELLAHFRACFPSKSDWLQKAPDTKATIQAWYGVLAGTEAVDAQAAITRLHATPDEMPASWDHIPATIARLAKTEAAKRRLKDAPVQDPNKYDPNECTQCYGGLVECYSPVTIAGVRGDKTWHKIPTHSGGMLRLIFESAPCPLCEDGDRIAAVAHNMLKKRIGDNAPELPRYDHETHCASDYSANNVDEHKAAIKAWLECRKPANYNESLSGWAE